MSTLYILFKITHNIVGFIQDTGEGNENKKSDFDNT